MWKLWSKGKNRQKHLNGGHLKRHNIRIIAMFGEFLLKLVVYRQDSCFSLEDRLSGTKGYR